MARGGLAYPFDAMRVDLTSNPATEFESKREYYETELCELNSLSTIC